MSWVQRYKLRQYLRTSLWILPACGGLAALGLINGLDWIERHAGWQSRFEAGAALAMFGALAGAMFTFIVFLSSTLLLVLQLASAQLSPRMIGLVYRDRVTRFALTLFTFTFTLTLGVLLRIDTSVPALMAHVAAYCCLLSLGVFLFLVDHLGRVLRPSGALRFLARTGHEVIRNVYPRQLTGQQESPEPRKDILRGEPACTIPNLRDGVLLAFDLQGLVALAKQADCVIELVPEVGDFVAADSPLFRIFTDKAPRPSASALRQSIALGQERTLRQDPALAFRIIVDIASKALSPAINDPTTAVLAIDQIHHLLRSVGGRHLDEGLFHDSSGALRLVYPTPDWEDFVCLAATEIRQFGCTSIQVARRLRAMLEGLAGVLPPHRAALLRNELLLLHRATVRAFPEPEDQALAGVGDLQGMGGRHSAGSPAAGTKSGSIEPRAI